MSSTKLEALRATNRQLLTDLEEARAAAIFDRDVLNREIGVLRGQLVQRDVDYAALSVLLEAEREKWRFAS